MLFCARDESGRWKKNREKSRFRSSAGNNCSRFPCCCCCFVGKKNLRSRCRVRACIMQAARARPIMGRPADRGFVCLSLSLLLARLVSWEARAKDLGPEERSGGKKGAFEWGASAHIWPTEISLRACDACKCAAANCCWPQLYRFCGFQRRFAQPKLEESKNEARDAGAHRRRRRRRPTG